MATVGLIDSVSFQPTTTSFYTIYNTFETLNRYLFVGICLEATRLLSRTQHALAENTVSWQE